jgi:hypothetical protein
MNAAPAANAVHEPSASKVAALAAAAILATVLGGTMSLAPLVWNDSTTFVSSALATLGSGTLQLHAGRGPGYVQLLAAMFKLPATLTDLVVLQYATWAATVALAAATVAWLLNWRHALLFVALVAGYPGIQYFQNLLMAESLYTSALTAALCLLLLGARATGVVRATVLLLGSIALAAAAGLLKIQGLAPFTVIGAAALWLAWRPGLRKGAVLVTLLTCVAAAQLAGSLQAKSRSADADSSLFGPKTLFCIHLDLALASDTTAPLAQQAFGAKSATFLQSLRKDYASTTAQFKTLGFYADACQYDTEIDRIGIESIGIEKLGRWYRDAFMASVARHPLGYVRKVAIQVAYGLKMSMPPLALGDSYASAPDQQAMVRRMMAEAGLPVSDLGGGGAVGAPAFARTEPVTSFVLRLLSVAMSLALLAALAGILWGRWRKHPDATPALLAALVWFAQIGGVALTHTLDVWRYITPVVPAGLLALVFAARIAADLWAQRRWRRTSG